MLKMSKSLRREHLHSSVSPNLFCPARYSPKYEVSALRTE